MNNYATSPFSENKIFQKEIIYESIEIWINWWVGFVHAFEDFLNDFERKDNIFIKKLIKESKEKWIYDESINYKNYLITIFQYWIENIRHDWAPETKKFFHNLG